MRGKKSSTPNTSTTKHGGGGGCGGGGRGGVIPLGLGVGDKERPSSTQASYLMNIKIPRSRTNIRVNIPKLLFPKRFHGGGASHTHNTTTNNNNNVTTNHQTTSFSKPGNLLSAKVGSIFTRVFRPKKKKSDQRSPDMAQVEQDTNSISRMRRISSSAGTKYCFGFENPSGFSPENSGLFTKKMRSVKLSRKVLLLPSASPSQEAVSGRCNRGGGVANGIVVMAKREGSGKLVRVSSRAVQTRRKLRLSKCDDSEIGRGGDGVELCKKRILMGGKCRPLNVSGTLQYDNNGVLLPEPLP